MTWLIITHCARANWTNVQWLVKRTEQHSTSRKTKEMLSRSNICSVTSLIATKLHWTGLNKGEQGSTRWSNALNILYLTNVQYYSLKCSVRLTGALVKKSDLVRILDLIFPEQVCLFSIFCQKRVKKISSTYVRHLPVHLSSIAPPGLQLTRYLGKLAPHTTYLTDQLQKFWIRFFVLIFGDQRIAGGKRNVCVEIRL